MKIQISDIPTKEILPGFTARFLHTEKNTIGFVEITAGGELPEHAHFHTQTTQVTEGELQLTINGKTTIYTPGMIAVIPSNVPHSAKALTDCKVTDIFSPVREDYK
jgi:quercetin dioxygenase-like cupin family protein